MTYCNFHFSHRLQWKACGSPSLQVLPPISPASSRYAWTRNQANDPSLIWSSQSWRNYVSDKLPRQDRNMVLLSLRKWFPDWRWPLSAILVSVIICTLVDPYYLNTPVSLISLSRKTKTIKIWVCISGDVCDCTIYTEEKPSWVLLLHSLCQIMQLQCTVFSVCIYLFWYLLRVVQG